MADFKLKDVIGLRRDTSGVANFVIGSHDKQGNQLEASKFTEADVDALLARISEFSPDDHVALAQAIVEPIEKVVPYAEMYNVFFQDQTLGDLEDNALPIEDTVAIAWETHQDGAARPVRSGYYWTRPSFVTYDTAIEVPWAMARKAGWNFLARQMRRATEALARKRDEKAKAVWEAALLPAHVVTVSGGALTRAGMNTVIKGAADIGFPVTRALVNPGTLADFADFTWPTGVNLPNSRVEQLVTTLNLGNYGGVEWNVNPHFETNRVKFSGAPNQVGWRQVRGGVRNSSDTDLLNKRDLYLIEDAEYAWYVGNDITLWEIRITA